MIKEIIEKYSSMNNLKGALSREYDDNALNEIKKTTQFNYSQFDEKRILDTNLLKSLLSPVIIDVEKKHIVKEKPKPKPTKAKNNTHTINYGEITGQNRIIVSNEKNKKIILIKKQK